MSQETNKIYTKERLEQVMNDFKTIVLPQIKAEIELRAKKTTVTALDTRVQAIEAIIGSASSADQDNIINKVVEFVDFFASITEETTLAGLLANISERIEALGNVGTPNKAVCDTAAATQAKAVTMPSTFSMVSGAVIFVVFTNGISVASATLSVNEGTAKPITYNGAALGANLVKAGAEVMLHYNGTSWNVVGDFVRSGFTVEYDLATNTKHIVPVGSATLQYDDETNTKHLTF